jgi:hypothetical protein
VPPAVKVAAASANLDDFVACYLGGKHGSQSRGYSENRYERKESERFKSFSYEELTKRDP